MTELISILLNPKVIAIIGPAGAILLGVAIVMYRLAMQFIKKYEEVQEKRITEAQAMQKEYFELANDWEKTLNAVLRALGKKNSNGGSNNV